MVILVFPFDSRNFKIVCKNLLQVKLEDKHQGVCFFDDRFWEKGGCEMMQKIYLDS